MKNICFEWRIEPFLYYNIEKFFQAYEISKQFDFNYITPFNYKQRSIFFHQSAPPGKQNSIISVYFCPVSDKEIQLSFKNKYEQTTYNSKIWLDYV